MQLLWWRGHLGSYALADVTSSLIADYRDKLTLGATNRGKHRTPATVNRYLAALSHAFTIAIKEWAWIDDNPLRKVTKPREPRGRLRYLSDEERVALLKACKNPLRHPYLYPVVVLALSTGGRSGELLNLTWNCIDFNKGRAILNNTKNGERRALPLVGHALEVVKALHQVRNLDITLVFPGGKPLRPIELRRAWLAALAEAGIKDFRFHDLRHSAASYLAMNGATLSEIAEVLGHKTFQMVKRYAHLSEGHVSKVVASMNEKIFSVNVKGLK